MTRTTRIDSTPGLATTTRQADRRQLVTEHNRSWVYVCASRNAETVAGVPLRLYARGGQAGYYQRRALMPNEKRMLSYALKSAVDEVVEITDGHPLLDLLQRVNDEMTCTELIEATVLHLELTGDAYWYLEMDELGMPTNIWPLMSHLVRIVRDDEGRLVGYLYGTALNRVALEAEQVIHFRYVNPADQDYGLSPLQAAFGAATLLEAEQEYIRTMYDRGGMPEIGIIVKTPLTEEQRRQYYNEWRERFASRRKGEKAIVLEGDMDVKTFGYPPKDVGIQFEQQFSREEIAAAFGIPLTMLQLNEASRAGAEAGLYQYLRITILPKLRRIEQKLNERLCPLYDDRLFLAFDNPVAEDRELRLREIETRLKSYMTTINEERALDGLPPVSWGDVPVVPLTPLVGGKSASTAQHEHKVQQPRMTTTERRLEDSVRDYLLGLARSIDERMRDVYR